LKAKSIGIMNKEQGMMNNEVRENVQYSTFNAQCSRERKAISNGQ
jgi:hypothetical protein